MTNLDTSGAAARIARGNLSVATKEVAWKLLSPKRGCLPDEIIQSDEIIASIAQDIGFKLIEIKPCREISCMKNRTELMGTTRESIIVLEKN